MKLIFRKIRAYVKAMRTKNIDSLLWRGYEVPENIKAEINLLFSMTVNELRAKFREVMGYNMNSRNKDFLLRKIAWKLQANIFGGLSEELKKRAINNVDFSRLRVRNTQTASAVPFESSAFDVRRRMPPRDNRLPMSGAMIVKKHEGKNISVKVLDKGFEYEGRNYRSLSAIAREITGTNWNGFKFFDL